MKNITKEVIQLLQIVIEGTEQESKTAREQLRRMRAEGRMILVKANSKLSDLDKERMKELDALFEKAFGVIHS